MASNFSDKACVDVLSRALADAALLVKSFDGPGSCRVSTVWDRLSRLVYLRIVSIDDCLYNSIPVLLTFCHIVSESGYHRFDESFTLVVCLRVLRRCREVFGTKNTAYSCEEFGHKCCAVVLKEKRKDTVRYDLMMEEYIYSMRRYGHRRRDSTSKFGLTIRDYYYILVSACCSQKLA